MNKKIQQQLDMLDKTYGTDLKLFLNYRRPYELLFATILSAQCTDKRVNEVTKELFVQYRSLEDFAGADMAELERAIHSCGFYNSKAEHILSASRDIIERFGGKVPPTREEMKTLAGVGQKTANVVYAVAFGGDAIAVDTHVFRVSNRVGLAHAKTPEETEKQLNALLDKSVWSKAHHYLIFHGRYTCKAQKPMCKDCPLAEYCEFYKSH